ncbi:MAG: hypothetical protein KGQ60_12475 [Planctomycetes bacterium]|nr:hypothetical protein [Planctomycetota bacterium]
MNNLGQINSLDREFRLGLQKGHPFGTSAIRYNSHSRPIANDGRVVVFADDVFARRLLYQIRGNPHGNLLI